MKKLQGKLCNINAHWWDFSTLREGDEIWKPASDSEKLTLTGTFADWLPITNTELIEAARWTLHWKTSEYHQPGPWSWLKYTSNFQVTWACGLSIISSDTPLSSKCPGCQLKPFGPLLMIWFYFTILDSSWQLLTDFPASHSDLEPCWISLSVLVLVIVNMYSTNPTSLQVSGQILLVK